MVRVFKKCHINGPSFFLYLDAFDYANCIYTKIKVIFIEQTSLHFLYKSRVNDPLIQQNPHSVPCTSTQPV